MKAIRTIFAAIACFLIAVGVFSVVGYELYFRHAEPVLPEQMLQDEPSAVDTQADDTQEEPVPDEPEPTPDVPSAEEERARELLADMTLEQKIYQMFFTTPEALTGVEAATRAGDATKEALLENPVGGLLYAQKNIEDEEQVTALLEGTQTFLTEGGKMPAFLAIDEEGGDIAPVASVLETTTFDTMAEIGETDDPNVAYEMGETIAKEVGALGFNVNFAPVADLGSNALIDTRAFSDDAELTASMVGSVVKGTQENGMLNAVTHFPGLGSIDDVAHIERTKLERSLDELKAEELLPFQAAIDQEVGFVIVSHAVLTALDDQRPCSMSPAAMTMLREEMGYRGIILTDALDIPAITDHYDSGEAALNAVNAGADMMLCPEDLDEAIQALLEAVEDGDIEESRINESVVRILAAKLKLGLIS
ncbi:MAG: glycoside hydrolase family 3 protein [Ruminococcaceae bacterium]|nr:glycoside hydrolase family 3 protein [Oscillospiraceae bacterium]